MKEVSYGIMIIKLQYILLISVSPTYHLKNQYFWLKFSAKNGQKQPISEHQFQ